MKSALTTIPLFSNMPHESLELLSTRIQNRTYGRNSVIIAEGEQSDSLYIVIEGRVKIYISAADGREMQLKTLGPGDYFGELALIDNKPRSASAITISDCNISVITSKDLLQYLSCNPEISINMLQVLAKRLREATESQRQLALMDVYGRLRCTLMTLCKEVNNTLLLEPKPTQQDFANMIGASREMVSRIFKDLKTDGYIETCKASITIRKALPEKW
jgi:CRP/FNR family cyclic AMP-dependent transcriptional regulator